MTAIKVIFAGTPEFARVALQHLLEAGFSVPLVLTQPDRPAGRGMKLQASPVKQCALEHGIALAQPRSLRLDGKYPEDAASARAALEQAGADVMVVAAYGLILPQWVLDLPRYGCLNIHASLLPRWRGAAPIHRAIEAGDAHTGVTIMQMDAGLDTGAMLLTRSLPIAEAITERYQDLDELWDLGEIDLHISGCINSCGHHHSGHIGILGVDKDGKEWYQITLGGADGSNLSGPATPGKIIGPSFSAAEVPRVPEALLNRYRTERQPLADDAQGPRYENFIDTVRRVGLEPFKAAANAARHPAETETA